MLDWGRCCWDWDCARCGLGCVLVDVEPDESMDIQASMRKTLRRGLGLLRTAIAILKFRCLRILKADMCSECCSRG